ncbi:hypothetical protein VTL71DRAFT_839 [Oculimacula yallundae]|uniref:Uncharacterized protein n=1 Tax=Oculimacula yallundae TaxID=86028 RepID=A0ABR4D166_9HELO
MALCGQPKKGSGEPCNNWARIGHSTCRYHPSDNEDDDDDDNDSSDESLGDALEAGGPAEDPASPEYPDDLARGDDGQQEAGFQAPELGIDKKVTAEEVSAEQVLAGDSIRYEEGITVTDSPQMGPLQEHKENHCLSAMSHPEIEARIPQQRQLLISEDARLTTGERWSEQPRHSDTNVPAAVTRDTPPPTLISSIASASEPIVSPTSFPPDIKRIREESNSLYMANTKRLKKMDDEPTGMDIPRPQSGTGSPVPNNTGTESPVLQSPDIELPLSQSSEAEGPALLSADATPSTPQASAPASVQQSTDIVLYQPSPTTIQPDPMPSAQQSRELITQCMKERDEALEWAAKQTAEVTRLNEAAEKARSEWGLEALRIEENAERRWNICQDQLLGSHAEQLRVQRGQHNDVVAAIYTDQAENGSIPSLIGVDSGVLEKLRRRSQPFNHDTEHPSDQSSMSVVAQKQWNLALLDAALAEKESQVNSWLNKISIKEREYDRLTEDNQSLSRAFDNLYTKVLIKETDLAATIERCRESDERYTELLNLELRNALILSSQFKEPVDRLKAEYEKVSQELNEVRESHTCAESAYDALCRSSARIQKESEVKNAVLEKERNQLEEEIKSTSEQLKKLRASTAQAKTALAKTVAEDEKVRAELAEYHELKVGLKSASERRDKLRISTAQAETALSNTVAEDEKVRAELAGKVKETLEWWQAALKKMDTLLSKLAKEDRYIAVSSDDIDKRKHLVEEWEKIKRAST